MESGKVALTCSPVWEDNIHSTKARWGIGRKSVPTHLARPGLIRSVCACVCVWLMAYGVARLLHGAEFWSDGEPRRRGRDAETSPNWHACVWFAVGCCRL